MGAELLGAEGAVDAGTEQIDVRDARPAGLDRLGGERPSSLENRERGHHRQGAAEVGEGLLDRVQAGLEHERVKGGFSKEDIDAPFDESLDLLAIGRHHFVVGDVAVAWIGHVAGNRELLVGGTDRAGHKPRLVRRLRGRRVGRSPGQRRGDKIHLPRVFLEPKVGERHARSAERVGFDDVGPSLEVGGMNALNRLSLR